MQHGGKNLVIVAALLGAGFFVGYLRFQPHLGREMAWTDGERTIAREEEELLRFAIWQAGEPLAGEVNTAAHESRPALSPDGRFVVFCAGEPGLGTDLYVAELDGGVAREPVPVYELNTEWDECAPAFGPRGFYFASDRDGEGGLDLYRCAFEGGEFGPPENLGPTVNTAADETDPAPLPGSGALAFASNRAPEGSGRVRHSDFDLYFARPGMEAGAFEVGPLDALNTTADDREPAFTAEGRTLVFASDRQDDDDTPLGVVAPGDFDLYRSVLKQGEWLPPVPLSGVNTDAVERGPAPSADGFTLLYCVEDERGDIWRAESLELFPLPGRPVGWLDLVILTTLLLLALLAWLAKRWETLEVLYKCALISLLVHLLMLWWFTRVHPEGEEVELPARDALFQVQLVSSSAARASKSTQERGGELAMEREPAREEESQPARGEAAPRELLAAASQAPARAVERSTQAAVAAPSRASQEVERSSEEAAAARPVELAATGETFERRSAAAPAVEVSAASELAQRSAREAAEVAAARGESAASRRNSAASTPTRAALAPEAGPAAEPVRVGSAAREGRVPERAGAESADHAESVALAAPAETATRRGGAAPGVEVELSPTGAERSRASSAPSLAVAQEAGDPGGDADGELRPRDLGAAPGRATAPAEPTFAGGALAAGETSKRTGELGSEVALREVADDAVAAPRGGGVSADADEGWLAAAASAPERAERSLEGGPRRFERAGRERDLPDLPAPPRAGVQAAPGPREEPALADASGAAADAAPSPRALPDVALDAPVEAGGGASPAEALAEASEAADGDAAGELEPVALGTRRTSRGEPDAPLPARFEPAETERGALEQPTFAGVEALAARAPDRAEDRPGRLDHTPYRSRFGREREKALELHGGGVETERAVALGLAYLASIQGEHGQWGSSQDYDDKYGHVSVGKTGLCLLAFLGAGHSPTSDTEYSANTRRALTFLQDVQDDDTGHFGYTSSYSHAIATYALAECYALTNLPELRRPIERAVQQILDHQYRTGGARRVGGWGYFYPEDRTYDNWPRASVTAWQVMALESARLGGVRVPDEAFLAAKQFLLNSWDESRGAFRYSHDPQRLRSSYSTLPGSTPASVFALSLLGEDMKDGRWSDARGYIVERRPVGYRWEGDDAFVLRARGNLYFWYYGTLSLFRIGGRDWERWNTAMKQTLLPSQNDDGSWEPISIYAREYAGDDRRDKSYSTAMSVLTLEVYYRYFTPLLKVE